MAPKLVQHFIGIEKIRLAFQNESFSLINYIQNKLFAPVSEPVAIFLSHFC